MPSCRLRAESSPPIFRVCMEKLFVNGEGAYPPFTPPWLRTCVEQERNDCLVTMHTFITHGDVWCKKQSFPKLPQTARSVTDEEEDDKKMKNRV